MKNCFPAVPAVAAEMFFEKHKLEASKNMSSQFQINIPEEVLTRNLTAFVVIGEIFRRQSQAVIVDGGSDGSLIFNLRANLTQQQYDRLIKKEILACLPNYNCTIDWPRRKMTVTRGKNANRPGRKKTVKSKEQETDRGSASVQ